MDQVCGHDPVPVRPNTIVDEVEAFAVGDSREDEAAGAEIDGGQAEGELEVESEHGIDSDDGGEERAVRQSRPIQGGSPEEVRRHRSQGHAVYRSWCKHCVAARRRDDAHKRRDDDQVRGIPCVHMDYLFPRDNRAGPMKTCLVAVNDATGKLAAHVVPSKGGSEESVVNAIDKDIKGMGINGDLIIKTDQENAIGDLVNAIARARGNKVTLKEQSPVKDSRGNGRGERAVQLLEGMLRSIIFDLSETIGERISVMDPCFSYLVEYAADCVNKFKVWSDGKTTYERERGKKYSGCSFPFGTPVLHRVVGHVEGGDMRERWLDGVYLGKVSGSDENRVLVQGGKVVKCRAIMEAPGGGKVTKEVLDSIVDSPLSAPGVITHEASTMPGQIKHQEGSQSIPPSIPRSFRITPQVLEQFGYTIPGCPRCAVLQRDGEVRRTVHHSAACRQRLAKAMKDHPEWSKVIERVEENQNRWMANKVEGGDEGRKREGAPEDRRRSSKPVPSEGEPERPRKAARADTFVPGQAGSSGLNGLPAPTTAVHEPERQAAADFGRDEDEDIDVDEGGDARQKRDLDDDEEGVVHAKRQRTKSRDVLVAESGEGLSMHASQRRSPSSVYDICEVFSPPRVTLRARELGMNGGWAIDRYHTDPVTNRRYNLLQAKDQKEVKRMLRRDMPHTLVVSPPCTLWSIANTTGNPSMQELQQAIEMIRFALELCDIQRRAGRHYVFEQPLSARSWKLQCVQEFIMKAGAELTSFDQCMYGQTSTDSDGTAPVYKPTRLMVSSGAFVEAFSRRCDGSHRHVQLQGSRTAKAAQYSQGMCDTIITVVDLLKKHHLELHMAKIDDMCEEDVDVSEMYDYGSGVFDDVTGASLDPERVKEGVAEEMSFMYKHGVWDYALAEDVYRKSPRPPVIGVRWVHVQKGSRVRSRLVGQEFANEKRDDLYAGTPPLAAMRYMASDYMSRGHASYARKLAVIDVKRAFLHGTMERDLYIRLPPEDKYAQSGLYLGRLRKSLYGTRDAPLAWQKVVQGVMKELEFHSDVVAPGMYSHIRRDLRVITHVDDFLVSGSDADVRWLIKNLGERYEIKSEVFGFGANDQKEIRFLGRTIRATSSGISIEGDPKHVDILLNEWNMVNSKPVDTPSVKMERDLNSEYMIPAEASRFRRAVARLTYISQDRADICFAARNLAGFMAQPRIGDEIALKRALRYLRGRPRSLLHYEVQEPSEILSCFTDSDWAGDFSTRRSTSGGVIRRGVHSIHWWSKLQARIALSSCEAEVNGLVKGASESLHLQHLAEVFGDRLEIILHTDASAARGVLVRAGPGKLKHLSAKQLWVQEFIAKGEMKITKIPRDHNMADAMTHSWANSEGKFFCSMGFSTTSSTGASCF